MKLRNYLFDVVAYVFLAGCIAFAATRADAGTAAEEHPHCYGFAQVTYEAAKARDRGVSREEALGIVLNEDDIYTEIVVFVFDNPQALATELAAEVYRTCMAQTVTEE